MNSGKYLGAALLGAAALLCGCAQGPANPVAQRNSALTTGNVELHIKTGVTTKSQVLDAFGAPNITTTDGSGHEVWTYQRAATVAHATSGRSYWTVILGGGSSDASGFEQSQRTMTLIIKFNKHDVVSSFRSRYSEF